MGKEALNLLTTKYEIRFPLIDIYSGFTGWLLVIVQNKVLFSLCFSVLYLAVDRVSDMTWSGLRTADHSSTKSSGIMNSVIRLAYIIVVQ